MNKKLLSATLFAVMLSGCASNGNDQVEVKPAVTAPAMPSWVLNPASANGFAASNCVQSSGNFSVDRNHAVSLARNTLAQNMDLKANVLEKSFQKMGNSAGMTTTGTSFEQVAKQITSVSLQNSQVEQVALVDIAGVPQICALVTIPKVASEKLFDKAMATQTMIDPSNKAALYKEFVSQKTAKELEQQVETLSAELPKVAEPAAPVTAVK